MTCNICAENFNKSNRFGVSCPYCNMDACRQCWTTWFLNETEPTCMFPNCGKDWTRAHIRENFTQKFITKDLKMHREQVLFDKERALLPATQPYVEVINLKKHLDKDIRAFEAQIGEIRNQMLDREAEYRRQRRILLGETDGGGGTRQERSAFIRACPVQDCRGFLSSQWKCGVCENWTCPECNLVKGTDKNCEHTCNADDVATAKLIANDTRSCPTCGMGIYKIDGCDQMWCTQCHTAFSFRTGRIENNIHNPHYYEWMRRTGQELARAPGDVPGGRCQEVNINHILVRNLMSEMQKILPIVQHNEYAICIELFAQDNETQVVINDIYEQMKAELNENITIVVGVAREIIHIEHYLRDNRLVNRIDENRQMRIDYLMKNLTEEDFKTQLQRKEKKFLKTTEIHNVLNLFTQSATDIILRFARDVGTKKYINRDTFEELNRLKEYVDECFADIARTYCCALPCLRSFGIRTSFPTSLNDIYEPLRSEIDIDQRLEDLCKSITHITQEEIQNIVSDTLNERLAVCPELFSAKCFAYKKLNDILQENLICEERPYAIQG